MRKKLLAILAITTFATHLGTATAFAQTNGYGQGQGREDTVNVNDYSTDVWDRFSRNYEFNSGPEYKTELGKPTNTNIVPRDLTKENVRRNKDTAYNPPSYGVFSGSFDTERSNPYYSPQNYSNVRDTSDYSVNPASSYGLQATGQTGTTTNYGTGNGTGMLPSTSTMATSATQTTNATTATNATTSTLPALTTVSYSPTPTQTQTVTSNKSELNTEPWLYTDGTIGTLSIPLFNVKVKIYEGESLANLKKGLAHFSFTSAYDGNVGICGHNDQEFKNLENLENGDEIIYETKYGKRTYVMTSREVIGDTDFSTLQYTTENQLTLITCVKGSSSERYSVVAIEK